MQKGLLAAGAAGAGCAFTYVGVQLFASPKPQRQFPSERERRETFDKLAKKLDANVRFDELVTGIGRMRRRLVQQAHGEVLEVAIGTGRNLSCYNSAKVTSVTGVDFSRSMLEVVDAKRKELEPIPLRLKLASAQKLDFEDGSFDTVVDTFGLCSFERPVQALGELKRVVKDDGQLLFLEHGASNWEFMQGILNNGQLSHVEKHGSYPNRKILELIKESGLHIVSMERKHFGTTYVLVCAPKEPLDKEAAAEP
eukprot:gnl/TRDRNA2_/TRDRNA2_195079_c0_seq1.p1 gnl/TRDRNA2_/TRDRNA2_195079_c0~~gnl/TRDRNA2_/TRDRNA2_195079_c0_seq1.p1  ORF type:complete len:253 (-),score=58.15 gnl/TRDRNA2_/TRDRNA2_195079_c0_seq1:163-921(-)